MNFNHEKLMLMMLYNTGTRLGLIHELRLMQCYLMPDEKVFCSSKRYAIIKLDKIPLFKRFLRNFPVALLVSRLRGRILLSERRNHYGNL